MIAYFRPVCYFFNSFDSKSRQWHRVNDAGGVGPAETDSRAVAHRRPSTSAEAAHGQHAAGHTHARVGVNPRMDAGARGAGCRLAGRGSVRVGPQRPPRRPHHPPGEPLGRPGSPRRRPVGAVRPGRAGAPVPALDLPAAVPGAARCAERIRGGHHGGQHDGAAESHGLAVVADRPAARQSLRQRPAPGPGQRGRAAAAGRQPRVRAVDDAAPRPGRPRRELPPERLLAAG